MGKTVDRVDWRLIWRGLLIRFRSAVLELVFVASEESAVLDIYMCLRIHRYRMVLHHRRALFDISLNGQCPSSSISFSTSEFSFCISSSIVPSPSSTCGNGCGECCLDPAESVLDRNQSPPFKRVESTHCLLVATTRIDTQSRFRYR